jgi:hypothetical protein
VEKFPKVKKRKGRVNFFEFEGEGIRPIRPGLQE